MGSRRIFPEFSSHVNAPPAARERVSGIAVGNQPALAECVKQAVRRYLRDLGDHPAQDLHDLVLHEVEAPLFAEVLRYYDGNQSRAATALGLNRSTLRKKLKQYKLA